MSTIANLERLMVRVLDESNSSEFIGLCKNGGITDFNLGSYDGMDQDKALSWIRTECEKFSKTKTAKFGVFLKDSNILIGLCGIFNSRNRLGQNYEINFRFAREHRGKGYALEASSGVIEYAFDKLLFEEIHATADLENIPSKRLLAKLGFEYIENIVAGEKTLEHWRLLKNPS